MQILLVHVYAVSSGSHFYSKHLIDSFQVKDIVIYDTVLLPPDTIRLTDTLIIADNFRNKPLKIKSLNTKAAVNKKIIQNKPSRYSISMSFSPFITTHNLYTATFGDSVTYSSGQPLNFYYEISSGLKFNNWDLYLGIDFTNFSEVSEKEQFTTSEKLIVHTNTQIKNHFYYAGFLFGAGYETGKHNFVFYPQADIGISKRLPSKSYKFESGVNIKQITVDEYSEYSITFSVSPTIAYKASKNILIILKPAYVYNLYHKNAFPFTYRNNFKLGFGLRLEL